MSEVAEQNALLSLWVPAELASPRAEPNFADQVNLRMSERHCVLVIPRFSLGQEFGKFRLQYAEFVIPGVAEDPEVESAFLLVIPPFGAECFQAFDFGFNVIGL